MFRNILRKLLYRRIELEQNGTLRIVPDHALYPKESRETHAARDGLYAMHACTRIKYHIARG